MLAVAIVASASGVHGADEVLLTIDNFDSVVRNGATSPWVVEFFSEMCGSCKAFAPTWHAFHEKLDGGEGLLVGRVNVDKKEGAKLAKSFVKLFDNGIPQVVFLPNLADQPKAFRTLKGETVPELVASLKTTAAQFTTAPALEAFLSKLGGADGEL